MNVKTNATRYDNSSIGIFEGSSPQVSVTPHPPEVLGQIPRLNQASL